MYPESFKLPLFLIKILGRKKDDDDIWGLLAGLFLGAVGLAILSSVINPKCPSCKNSVKKGDPLCPSCGTLLEWK